jgi:hypothetical protein
MPLLATAIEAQILKTREMNQAKPSELKADGRADQKRNACAWLASA